MKTITMNGFIVCKKEVWEKEMTFTWAHIEMPDYGYMTVAPHTIEFEVPEGFNPIAAEVDLLNKQKEKLMQEFNARVKEINDRIANITCLEFNPTEAEAS